MVINGYKLIGELQNANSGFSKWGFAVKNGTEYFIKELIDPVYPVDQRVMSEEMFRESRAYCARYEAEFREFFERINNSSRGNLVRIQEFFRCGSRYYLVTEKIPSDAVMLEEIARSSDQKKLFLLKSVAQCFADLHRVGIVHFDVKLSNVLVKRTKLGNYVAKLIDFDSGFFKENPPKQKELGGDLTHLAPETVRSIFGEPVVPDEKSDIFALGLLFHEYCTGDIPVYGEQYDYPYEAVLEHDKITLVSDMLPAGVEELIFSMLQENPSDRPSAQDVLAKLTEMLTPKDVPITVTQLSVKFGGFYGKSVTLDEKGLRYCNTIHPKVAGEARAFPASYTAEGVKPLSKPQAGEILSRLSDAGLFDLVSPKTARSFSLDEAPQTITVYYSNGSTYEYIAPETPDQRFEKITELLCEYCEFMQLDPAWFEANPEEPTASDPTVDAIKDTTEPEQPKKIDGWFSPAGDL